MFVKKEGNKIYKVVLSSTQHENIKTVGKVDGLCETEVLSVIIIMGIKFAMKNLVNADNES